MSQALKSVGACFAVTTAKCILPNDPFGAIASYHIHPDCSYPHQDSIIRVYSQKQFADWIKTAKAVQRMTDEEKQFDLWESFWARWY